MSESTFLVYKDEFGQAEVRDETVAKIAALAATDVDGVEAIANGVTKDLISIISRKKLEPGIEIVRGEGTIDIYIVLVLKMGCDIREVCAEVQRKVKAEIEDMVGITVKEVNIRIANIKADK